MPNPPGVGPVSLSLAASLSRGVGQGGQGALLGRGGGQGGGAILHLDRAGGLHTVLHVLRHPAWQGRERCA